MRFLALCLVMVSSFVLLPSDSATAGVNRECKIAAKVVYKGCRNECRAEYRTEKDLCRNVDPACGLSCRAERAACIEPFEEAVDACKDICRADLRDDKEVCRLIEDEGARDACIDAAQIAAFICKDALSARTTAGSRLRWMKSGGARASKSAVTAQGPASGPVLRRPHPEVSRSLFACHLRVTTALISLTLVPSISREPR